MKTVLILRHAKSSRDDDEISDHERPLNERGKRDAPRVGEVLRNEFPRPQRVFSSSAKRAKKTAEKAIEASGYHLDVIIVEELYLAPPEAYLRELRHLSDDVSCVLFVGHNPGLEELVAGLTGHHDHLPTSALVQVELSVDHWREVKLDESATLVRAWRPKDEEPAA